MADPTPYPTPGGVEAAIKNAAKRAAAGDPSLTTNERIRLAHFDRFLCRVFSDSESSEWMLKGGTGMLARVPSSRPTLDIDLYRNGFTLDEALADLQRLAAVDLRDHFSFASVGVKEISTGDAQPYTQGYDTRSRPASASSRAPAPVVRRNPGLPPAAAGRLPPPPR